MKQPSRRAVYLSAALTTSAAADFDAGLAAHRAGDYGKAHDQWKACAQADEPRCQYALGVLLDDGAGVERDVQAALRWYLLAARGEVPEAMMQLGFVYATGRNGAVSQDPVRAWAWFSRAAALGLEGAAEHRRRVGDLLTAEELQRAEALADELSIRYRQDTN